MVFTKRGIIVEGIEDKLKEEESEKVSKYYFEELNTIDKLVCRVDIILQFKINSKF